jgi:hypothetical protein
MALAKKVLRYLQGRKRIPLRWCARSCQQPHLPGHIYGYADAGFVDIKPDRLSSMGYVSIINNGAVSWRSTRTPLVTLSAAESEIIALSAATQEAVYLRKLANELGFTQTSPTTLYEDCTAAVALSKENRFRNRSKSPFDGPSSLNDSTPPSAIFKSFQSAAKSCLLISLPLLGLPPLSSRFGTPC